MSIEALIVFALFVLVPLVERLLREVQQRNQRAGGQAGHTVCSEAAAASGADCHLRSHAIAGRIAIAI